MLLPVPEDVSSCLTGSVSSKTNVYDALAVAEALLGQPLGLVVLQMRGWQSSMGLLVAVPHRQWLTGRDGWHEAVDEMKNVALESLALRRP